MSVSGRISVVIELEMPGNSRSLFRLRLGNRVVGENLTAVQTHLSYRRDSRSDYTAEASGERVRARIGLGNLFHRVSSVPLVSQPITFKYPLAADARPFDRALVQNNSIFGVARFQTREHQSTLGIESA